jgi:hypothetical protein
MLHKLPHHQGRRVPAAGDQPAVRTSGRYLRIDMEGLRIEHLSEENHFSLVDADASAIVRRPGQVIIEVPEAVIGHIPDYSSTL